MVPFGGKTRYGKTQKKAENLEESRIAGGGAKRQKKNWFAKEAGSGPTEMATKSRREKSESFTPWAQ